MPAGYIGRFAPSPSGPLHMGSLLTALASFLDARAAGGQWLLRIDDIDHQRCRPQWSTHIQETLQRYGFRWDGPALVQSQRLPLYQQYLQQLREAGYLYACTCSRSQRTAQHTAQRLYAGVCRNRGLPFTSTCSWRLRLDDTAQWVSDLRLGTQQFLLPECSGDIILRRRDGAIAYHLATVVDDALCQVTHVLRGEDLWPETPVQLFLQGLCQFPSPQYLHVPLVTDTHGRKLSKQNHAQALPTHHTGPVVMQLLTRLGMVPEPDWQDLSPEQLLQQAVIHWDRSTLCRMINTQRR